MQTESPHQFYYVYSTYKDHRVSIMCFLFLEIKPKALFGLEVYFMELFSIWAMRMSGRPVVGMSICMTSCTSKLASEGLWTCKVSFLSQPVEIGLELTTAFKNYSYFSLLCISFLYSGTK